MVSDDWAPADTSDGSSAGVSAEDSIPLRSRRLLAATAAAPKQFHFSRNPHVSHSFQLQL